jgi:hypothetical protein
MLLWQLTNPSNRIIRGQKRQNIAKTKLESIKEVVKETQAQWDQRKTEIEEEKKKRIESLSAIHKLERESFEKDWANPDFLLPFHKPSAQLLQLRDLEYAYAMRKDFDRAEMIAKRVQQMEEEEVKLQKDRAIASMRKAFENLQERHEKELSCLLMKERKWAEKIDRDFERKLRPLQIQAEKYEGEVSQLEKDVKTARRHPEVMTPRVMRSPGKRNKGVSSTSTLRSKVMLPVEGLDVRRLCKKRVRV